MGAYLTFVAAAPLASFGDVAPGERRGSAGRPTRSGLLGLVAAALGLERDDRAALAAVTEGYGLACAVLPGATPLLDYHTVQTPRGTDLNRFSRGHGRPPATRAEELAAGRHDTLLSRRDYWCDVVVLAALWARHGAPHDLETLAQALRHPRFALYLGRKSCPLMLPLNPRVETAEDAVAAIGTIRPPGDLGRFFIKDGAWTRPPHEVSLDPDDPAARADGARETQRRDLSRHHPGWFFESRREVTVPLPAPSGAGTGAAP